MVLMIRGTFALWSWTWLSSYHMTEIQNSGHMIMGGHTRGEIDNLQSAGSKNNFQKVSLVFLQPLTDCWLINNLNIYVFPCLICIIYITAVPPGSHWFQLGSTDFSATLNSTKITQAANSIGLSGLWRCCVQRNPHLLSSPSFFLLFSVSTQLKDHSSSTVQESTMHANNSAYDYSYGTTTATQQ